MVKPPMTAPETSAIHRIGPNAITRVAEALRESGPEDRVEHLYTRAGLAHYLAQPPEKMVDEREVTRLHQVLRDELGIPAALEIARSAGVRTGDYLLAHRIPKGVQVLLKWLPARLASQVLLNAIQRHAWTFAGSGAFSARFQPRAAARARLRFRIEGCLVCRRVSAKEPACEYYAATFERLFRTLVHREAAVRETRCEACGDPACEFDIRW